MNGELTVVMGVAAVICGVSVIVVTQVIIRILIRRFNEEWEMKENDLS